MIIRRDQQGISALFNSYNKAASRLQPIINDLVFKFSKYIQISDQQIVYLFTNKPVFDKWLDGEIEGITNSFNFQWQQDATKEELAVLRQYANEAQVKILSILKDYPDLKAISTGERIRLLSFDNFVVKDLKVNLKKGLKEEITDLFTLYNDNPNRQKVFELSNKIKGLSEELEAILPKGLNVFSTPPWANPLGPGFIPGKLGILDLQAGKIEINENMLSKIV